MKTSVHQELNMVTLLSKCYLKPFAMLLIIVRTTAGLLGEPIYRFDHRSTTDILRYRVAENSRLGLRIGNVLEDSGLRLKYDQSVLRRLEFRFVTEPPPIPVAIDTRDGVIRTSGVIDRDIIAACRRRESCEIAIDVAVHPVEHFRIVKVVVEVLDENDNAPKFSDNENGRGSSGWDGQGGRNPVVLVIVESAAAGTTFLLPSATDADGLQFGVRRYELDSDSSKFGLKLTPTVDGFLDVRLLLRERLDREERSEYQLRLVVFDGGKPPLTDSLNLTVKVADANDNDPQFERQSYEARVAENSPLFSNVITVRAIDADDGQNGHVTYGFSAQTLAQFGKLFGVDATTGVIYVKGNIDREMTDRYVLTVTAEDSGPDSHVVDVVVHVSVDDVNDNKPLIAVTGLPTAVGSDAIRVQENAPPGTFVAHVTVEDRDLGKNGTTNCSIVNDLSGHDGVKATSHGVGGGLFSLVHRPLLHQSEMEYRILTAHPLDREKTDRHNVSVLCSDAGTPVLQAWKHVMVLVIDENDNSPVFTSEVYTATIKENNFIGAPIVQVTATDADIGDNAVISYSVVGPASSLFTVNKRGVITARASLDREEKDVYHFKIVAVNGGANSDAVGDVVAIPVSEEPTIRGTSEGVGVEEGKPERGEEIMARGTASVHLTIADVNDERPVFTFAVYSFSVSENEAPGTRVGEVLARDRDLHPNNVIRYFFPNENLATDNFNLDPHNGTITTNRTLDQEMVPVYYLTVSAVDQGFPPLTGTATVVVYVTDVNDNDPMFVCPSPTNNIFNLSNRAEPGYTVLTLEAKDADKNLNARISYHLTSCIEGEKKERNTDLTKETSDEEWSYDAVTGPSGRDMNVVVSPAFGVDPIRGSVFVNRRLSEVDHCVYRLIVSATDQGTPSRSTWTSFRIVVNKTLPYYGAAWELEGTQEDSSTASTAQVFLARLKSVNALGVVMIIACASLVIILTIIIILTFAHHHRRRHCHPVTGGDGGGGRYRGSGQKGKQATASTPIDSDVSTSPKGRSPRKKTIGVSSVPRIIEPVQPGPERFDVTLNRPQSSTSTPRVELNGTVTSAASVYKEHQTRDQTIINDVTAAFLRCTEIKPSYNNQHFESSPTSRSPSDTSRDASNKSRDVSTTPSPGNTDITHTQPQATNIFSRSLTAQSKLSFFSKTERGYTGFQSCGQLAQPETAIQKPAPPLAPVRFRDAVSSAARNPKSSTQPFNSRYQTLPSAGTLRTIVQEAHQDEDKTRVNWVNRGRSDIRSEFVLDGNNSCNTVQRQNRLDNSYHNDEMLGVARQLVSHSLGTFGTKSSYAHERFHVLPSVAGRPSCGGGCWDTGTNDDPWLLAQPDNVKGIIYRNDHLTIKKDAGASGSIRWGADGLLEDTGRNANQPRLQQQSHSQFLGAPQQPVGIFHHPRLICTDADEVCSTLIV